jgi:hypothetical protein
VAAETPPEPGNEDVDPTQYEAMAEAYYQSVVGRASAARSRAQAGFAIVSAISGFAIAAAFTAQIDKAPPITKLLAFVGVVFWVIAAALFLWASIIQPPSEKDQGKDPVQLDRRKFVDRVALVSDQEALRVNSRVVLAGSAVIVALLLTLATAFTVVFFPPTTEQTTADVTVTESYFGQFLAQCHVEVTKPGFHDLVGTLDIPSLNSDFIVLDIEPGVCVGQGKFAIPRSAVLLVEEYPKCQFSLPSGSGALPLYGPSSSLTPGLIKTADIVAPLQSPTPAPVYYSNCGSNAQPFRSILRKLFPFARSRTPGPFATPSARPSASSVGAS